MNKSNAHLYNGRIQYNSLNCVILFLIPSKYVEHIDGNKPGNQAKVQVIRLLFLLFHFIIRPVRLVSPHVKMWKFAASSAASAAFFASRASFSFMAILLSSADRSSDLRRNAALKKCNTNSWHSMYLVRL